MYPALNRYDSCPDNPEREADAAVALILEMAAELLSDGAQYPDLSAFGLGSMAPRYEQVFRQVAAVQDSQ